MSEGSPPVSVVGGSVFGTFHGYSWLFIGSFAVGLGATAMALATLPCRASARSRPERGLRAPCRAIGAGGYGLVAVSRLLAFAFACWNDSWSLPSRARAIISACR